MNETNKVIKVKKYNNVTNEEALRILEEIFPEENFVFYKESPNSYHYTLLDENTNLDMTNEYLNRIIVHPKPDTYSHIELIIDNHEKTYTIIISHGINVKVCSIYQKKKICIDTSTLKEKTELNFLSLLSK